MKVKEFVFYKGKLDISLLKATTTGKPITLEDLLYSRCFPTLVVHEILIRTFLVVLIDMLVFQDFGLIKEFMVETQYFLILLIIGLIRGSHDGTSLELGTKGGRKFSITELPVWHNLRLHGAII